MKKIIIPIIVGIVLICASSIIPMKGRHIREYQNAAIAAGPYHAMVIKENGDLISWGDGFWGVLGTSEGYEQFPTEASKVMENVRWISANQFASYAVDDNGTLWSWGYRALGREGEEEKPMAVMEDVLMAYAGTFFGLALKKDGSLWGWGEYTVGQLGRGMGNELIIEPERYYVEKHENMPVKIMEDVKYVSAGCNSSFVIKNDDTLWSFGGNNMGQLGDGTTENRTTPIKIMEGGYRLSATKIFFSSIITNLLNADLADYRGFKRFLLCSTQIGNMF